MADVESYCTQLRHGEDLCYLDHRRNEQIIGLAKKHALLGMLVPRGYGGRGADALTYARALARINREGTGVRTFFSGHGSIGQYPILRYGSPVQKARYLPSCTGERVLAFGLTEPEAGSNPLEGTTTYRRDGDRFLLSGVKYLISNVSIADAVIVCAFPEGKSWRERRMSGSSLKPRETHSRRNPCTPSRACTPRMRRVSR